MSDAAALENSNSRPSWPVTPQALAGRADQLVRALLRPKNETRLEQYRFPGSTNRVYRVPLGEDTEEFIVIKLPPSRWVSWLGMLKCHLRNVVYGEHDIAIGNERVTLEIERYREWASEGLRTPQLIETSIPGVRIIQGLPYPTFYTILTSKDVSAAAKLEALARVTRSLSHQHKTALLRGRKGLVHTYPGPWNIMFDRENGDTYWYDLEHPAEYPKMSIDALITRALRIFVYGVLDHLEDRSDEVIRAVVQNYEVKPMLWRLVESLHPSQASLVLRVLSALRLKKRNFERQQRIASRLAAALRAEALGQSHYETARP